MFANPWFSVSLYPRLLFLSSFHAKVGNQSLKEPRKGSPSTTKWRRPEMTAPEERECHRDSLEGKGAWVKNENCNTCFFKCYFFFFNFLKWVFSTHFLLISSFTASIYHAVFSFLSLFPSNRTMGSSDGEHWPPSRQEIAFSSPSVTDPTWAKLSCLWASLPGNPLQSPLQHYRFCNST